MSGEEKKDSIPAVLLVLTLVTGSVDAVSVRSMNEVYPLERVVLTTGG